VFSFLAGAPVDRPPVMPITMMFASRHAGFKYGNYVRDHRLMVEAQIRVAEDFGIDQVSGISDPTRESHDLGATVQFFEDQPPAMAEENALLAEPATLARLKLPDPLGGGRMTDRVEAMALFKQRVGKEKIVEGWIEGPADAAANLRGINTLMLDFTDNPAFVNDLMEFCVAMELSFARAQVEAGADLIGMGDPSSSIVGPWRYEQFLWPFQKKIVDGVRALGAKVRVHICGNTRKSLDLLGQLGADILDVDSMVPVAEAREKCGPEQVLLGGIDPVRTLSLGTPEQVTASIRECYRIAGPRYIAGAGCEVPPEVPDRNLTALAESLIMVGQAPHDSGPIRNPRTNQ
jgi:MtaA/CmuA family methyltransferase